MKILWFILKSPEISGELSGELQPAKKFSSPTPAKSDFLLSAEISGDLLETEISTTLLFNFSFKASPIQISCNKLIAFIFFSYLSSELF